MSACPPGTNIHDDIGPPFRVFCIFMIVIPSLCVFLRFWSRWLGSNPRGSRFWWDDWTCLAAWPPSMISIALEAYLVSQGLGRHACTIPLDVTERSLKILYGIYFTYQFGTSMAKCSALFFYERVFDVRGSRTRYVIWLAQGLVWAWWLTFSMINVGNCTPTQKFWQPWLKEGSCLDTHDIYLGNATTAVSIDLLILIIPLPLIWRLQLSLKNKLLIMCVFAVGYSVIIVSVGRLVSSYVAGEALVTDVTYAGVPTYYWFTAELTIALAGICLPAMAFLVRRAHGQGVHSLFTRSNNQSAMRSKASGVSAISSPFRSGDRGIPLKDRTLDSESQFTTDEPPQLYGSQAHITDVPVADRRGYWVDPSHIRVKQDVEVWSRSP